VVICLEGGADDLHMVHLMSLPPQHLLLRQNPDRFTFLLPSNSSCPGKEAVKRVTGWLWSFPHSSDLR